LEGVVGLTPTVSRGRLVAILLGNMWLGILINGLRCADKD